MADPREDEEIDEDEIELACPECGADLRQVGLRVNTAIWASDWYSFDDSGAIFWDADDQELGDRVDGLDRDIDCGACHAIIRGDLESLLFDLADSAESAN